MSPNAAKVKMDDSTLVENTQVEVPRAGREEGADERGSHSCSKLARESGSQIVLPPPGRRVLT
jgi:hypothetical protein